MFNRAATRIFPSGLGRVFTKRFGSFLRVDFRFYEPVYFVAFAQDRFFDFAGRIARDIVEDDLPRAFVARETGAEEVHLVLAAGHVGF